MAVVFLVGEERELSVYPAMTDVEFRLTSELWDFENRRIKLLSGLEVGLDSPVTLQAAIAYRYGSSKSMVTSRWKSLNKEGQCAPMTSGIEFQIKLKASDYTSVHVDSLKAKYSIVDKRWTMGAKYGLQNAEGSPREAE